MKVSFSKVEKEVKRFQEGGAMPEGTAPVDNSGAAPAGEAPASAPADPMLEILQGAMQAVQTNDGNLALQVCAALVQVAQGGAGAPGGTPAPEEAGEPVYKKGGRLAYRKK